MSILKSDECRVLGVLVEKAQTTPTQYPLTLNALITGCNQKNNRDPVMNLSEDGVLDAIDGLRAKGLIREVMLTGSRVQKFRHVAREAMEVSTSELVILAEMLLRGPQTIGELRGRASRMHPLESTEVVSNLLDHLMERPEPMVKKIAPAPGSRAPRYAQLLCPDLHPIDVMTSPGPTSTDNRTMATSPDLEQRMGRLEDEVASLKRMVIAMSRSADDPSLVRREE